jgi:DNA-binding response OmpR family regulator
MRIKMLEEEKILERMYKMDWLNDNGLKQYIGYLRREIQDHSERIKEIISKKGLHKSSKE